MQTTPYFREQVMVKRSYLQYAWIRMWGYVPAIGKYLRVVTLVDGLTVHNAFPDRSYKEHREL